MILFSFMNSTYKGDAVKQNRNSIADKKIRMNLEKRRNLAAESKISLIQESTNLTLLIIIITINISDLAII